MFVLFKKLGSLVCAISQTKSFLKRVLPLFSLLYMSFTSITLPSVPSFSHCHFTLCSLVEMPAPCQEDYFGGVYRFLCPCEKGPTVPGNTDLFFHKPEDPLTIDFYIPRLKTLARQIVVLYPGPVQQWRTGPPARVRFLPLVRPILRTRRNCRLSDRQVIIVLYSTNYYSARHPHTHPQQGGLGEKESLPLVRPTKDSARSSPVRPRRVIIVLYSTNYHSARGPHTSLLFCTRDLSNRGTSASRPGYNSQLLNIWITCSSGKDNPDSGIKTVGRLSSWFRRADPRTLHFFFTKK